VVPRRALNTLNAFDTLRALNPLDALDTLRTGVALRPC